MHGTKRLVLKLILLDAIKVILNKIRYSDPKDLHTKVKLMNSYIII